MQSFKQYLLKENTIDPEEYVDTVNKALLSSKSITVKQKLDGTAVSYNKDTNEIEFSAYNVNLSPSVLVDGELPFQIADFGGNQFEYFEPDYWENGLKSLKNFPKSCDGGFKISTSKLNDYSNGPEFVDSGEYSIKTEATEIKNLKVKTQFLYIDGTNLEKLSGLEKSEIREIRIVNGHNLKGNFLGLLKVKGLTNVLLLAASKGSDAAKAINIIRNHLEDKNIIACQKELYDNDLDEYAEL
jgi:hypothetical protein